MKYQAEQKYMLCTLRSNAQAFLVSGDFISIKILEWLKWSPDKSENF